MLYLSETDVQSLLPVGACIHLLEVAFAKLASGEALNHPRRRLTMPTRSVLHYMAASDGKYFGAKLYSTNPKTGAHFIFLLYRAYDGQPLAVIEANHLGRIRTGAASGYATRLLARPDSRTVGLIGTGFQARTQLDAMVAVLPVERARVWSRSSEKRTAFAAECTATLGIPVEAVATAEEAARDVDILITSTNAGVPVVEAEWVAAGTHINAMGSNQPQRRELPDALVRRCDLIVVDSLEQARIESGDLLLALGEGEWSAVRELQEVAAGVVGRTFPHAITLFKSNGLALEDVAAAGFVYETAVARGTGRPVYS